MIYIFKEWLSLGILTLIPFHFIPNHCHQKTYKETCQSVIEKRTSLLKEGSNEIDLQLYIENSLLNNIIPYWLGTKWSFEGHTSIPNQGYISCGYFISTVLRDTGFISDRYKYGKMSPVEWVKTIGDGRYKTIEFLKYENGENKILASFPDGIHIIGFGDFHVGFLLIENRDIKIIHSDFVHEKVIIEKAFDSYAFNAYSPLYICEFSSNLNWLKKLVN